MRLNNIDNIITIPQLLLIALPYLYFFINAILKYISQRTSYL